MTATPPQAAVVKLGGGLLEVPGAFDAAIASIARAARVRPLVVVPGGGPFADAVRSYQQGHPLSRTAAHWMAIAGMDQYAMAIADRLEGGAVVCDPAEVSATIEAGRIPVLAPSRWMQAVDVLPHSWDATSDSVAAFVAGALDAGCLVLLKPVPGTPDALADPGFRAVLPAGLRTLVLGPAELDRLVEVVAN
ncbi:MAG TPA: hypothetical protein VFK09_12845 [Gemmatimonadales bacterium]|nr:hypothetical protein [Gemmatimonadales bacterium]